TTYWVHDFFFFQAEDGIRAWSVTGVQTCALPIWRTSRADTSAERGSLPCARSRPFQVSLPSPSPERRTPSRPVRLSGISMRPVEIGRASCREGGESSGGAVGSKKQRGGEGESERQ